MSYPESKPIPASCHGQRSRCPAASLPSGSPGSPDSFHPIRHIPAGPAISRKRALRPAAPSGAHYAARPLLLLRHARSSIVEFVQFLCIVTLGLLVAQIATAIGQRLSGNE